MVEEGALRLSRNHRKEGWHPIQSSASSLDFDFDGWGRERFDKAARGLTGDRLESLLEEVTRDD